MAYGTHRRTKSFLAAGLAALMLIAGCKSGGAENANGSVQGNESSKPLGTGNSVAAGGGKGTASGTASSGGVPSASSGAGDPGSPSGAAKDAGAGNGTAPPVEGFGQYGSGTAESGGESSQSGSETARPDSGTAQPANGSSAETATAAISFSVEPCKQGVQPSGATVPGAVSVFERTVQPEGNPLTGIQAISVRRIVDEAGYGYRFGASYALTGDGALYRWGMQDYASLTEEMAYPVRVEDLPVLTATEGRFALDANGNVWFLEGEKKPRKLNGLDRVKRIRQGGDNQLAVMKEDGTVWTWENVYKYEVGKGERWDEKLTPAEITGVTDISAERHAVYVLKSDGTLVPVPFDGNSVQPTPQTTVVLPNGAKIVRAEGATDYSSLFLRADSGDWFSYNVYTKELQQLNGLQDAVKVTGGDGFTLALFKDGTVRGRGAKREMLHPGSTEYTSLLGDTSLPPTDQAASPAESVRIEGLTDIVDIQSGSDHALALRRDGTVMSWGSNSYGQLGRLQHTADRLTEVGTLRGGASLLLLGFDGLAVLKDGDVYRVDAEGRSVPWVLGQNAIKASYGPEGPLFLTRSGQLILTQYRGTGCRLVTASSPIRDINEDGGRTLLAKLDNGLIVKLTPNGNEVKAVELQLPKQAKPARLFGYPFPVVLTEDGTVYTPASMSDVSTELKRIPSLPKVKTWGTHWPAYFEPGGIIGYALGEDGAVYEVSAKLPEGTPYDSAVPFKFVTKRVQTGIASLYGWLTIAGSGRLYEQHYRYRFEDSTADVLQIRDMRSTYNFYIEGPGSLAHAAVTKDERVLWLGDMPFGRLSEPPALVSAAP